MSIADVVRNLERTYTQTELTAYELTNAGVNLLDLLDELPDNGYTDKAHKLRWVIANCVSVDGADQMRILRANKEKSVILKVVEAYVKDIRMPDPPAGGGGPSPAQRLHTAIRAKYPYNEEGQKGV